ncbi:hypothetical protein [Paenibacillus larvae]|uniref:hypothetical protein n=1 Tax=Paenibacillus larvae TaxID=1464 RepID=UPI002891B605|nr:hypothetical protein [Paenibacillus larvae]MDT2193296.1 hypothetical protein [Paenibacillus larvae]
MLARGWNDALLPAKEIRLLNRPEVPDHRLILEQQRSIPLLSSFFSVQESVAPGEMVAFGICCCEREMVLYS